MKRILTSLLVFWSANAFSSESQLLESALSCKLKDSQMRSLMQDLKAQDPAFAKPYQQYGAPSVDVYKLHRPVSALGYSATEVVVTPGRILLAVPDKTVSQAAHKLKLKEEPYSPASRDVRPTVSIVALHLSNEALNDKLLVGCQYANNDAAAWIR